MNQQNAAQSGMAKINGADLYYDVNGQGEPLLLIHAGIADSRMWAAQVSAFAEAYRVIRFDLRGFGRSNLPGGRFSNPEDVRAILDYANAPTAHILGISFGGLIAIDFALTHPDRLKSLILGAPSVSGSTPSDRIRQFWAEEDKLLEKGDLEGATELNLRLWVDGPHRTPDQVDAAVRTQVGEMQLNAFKVPEPDDVEDEELDPPALGRLSEIVVPTLLLVGSLDLDEKLALVDHMAAELPNAQKSVIADVAHMLNMEKPDEFNREILAFLGDLK